MAVFYRRGVIFFRHGSLIDGGDGMTDFQKVYAQYFEDVFRFLRGLTADEQLAEELKEETFFKALRSLDRFQGGCEIRVWLCQIAKNAYFSYRKKHRYWKNGRVWSMNL